MEHSVMVVAEGPTCVFQKSSVMNLKNGSTTDKRKSIRSSRAPSSRPTLSHTRRTLVSEDATVPYQCTLRCHTYGLFLLVPREGRGDALECVAYFLYVHVVENVKGRGVPGLHNGVINTREVGPKTGKHANELPVHTVIGATGQHWGSWGQRLTLLCAGQFNVTRVQEGKVVIENWHDIDQRVP